MQLLFSFLYQNVLRKGLCSQFLVTQRSETPDRSIKISQIHYVPSINWEQLWEDDRADVTRLSVCLSVGLLHALAP